MDGRALSQAEFVALKDCARFSRGSYIWKPKTMQKLAVLGLVETVEGAYGQTAYALTKAGYFVVGDRK